MKESQGLNFGDGQRPDVNKRTGLAWWLALFVAGLNLAMVLAGQAVSLVFAGSFILDARGLASIVYSIIAVLILARYRRHTVGWIFIVIGFFSAAGALRVSLLELEPSLNSENIKGLFALIGHISWSPALLLPISLVLLYFPDGHLPSRRWWSIVLATILSLLGLMIYSGFYPYPAYPFGIRGAAASLDILGNISLGFFTIGSFGSLLAVSIRYRRASGEEKVKMKWLVYSAIIGIFLLVVTRLGIGLFYHPSGISDLLTLHNPVADIVYALMPSALAIVIAIAILRHRLFDIDVIIRRTLQYALLTGILALVYFGLVVSLQGIFSAVGNQQSPIFIVISTLVIAGLFNPLRLRIQEIIDRRFYRKKYESEQALAQFAAAARDEVDLNRLTDSLLGVVHETIQPEHLSLWLANSEMEGS